MYACCHVYHAKFSCTFACLMSYFFSRSAWISVEQGYTHLRKNWALDAYGRLVYLTCRGTSWNGQLLIWHISKHNWFDMKVDDSETSLDDSTATEYLFQNSRGRISSSWKNRSLTCLSEHSLAELMYDQRAIESDWLWEATRNIPQTSANHVCSPLHPNLWQRGVLDDFLRSLKNGLAGGGDLRMCEQGGDLSPARGAASRHHMARQIRQTWWKAWKNAEKRKRILIWDASRGSWCSRDM